VPKVTDIKKFKDNKKTKLLIKDLEVIVELYSLMIRALRKYSKYSNVLDSIETIQGNKLLSEMYLKKYKSMIESDKDE
jgi:hypothetical protein